MAEDLKRFIFEEKDNFRRYRSNIEAIIKKYDQHFPDDFEIDLETMTSYSKKDENKLRRMKPKPFGHSKLFTTKRKEMSETYRVNSAKDESVFSLLTDDDGSLVDLTLKDSPSDRISPDGKDTYNQDVSVYTDVSPEEDNTELLSLKTSYFEIISDKHDEPSDAETLSSYSSESLEDELDSEEADDEDSQADDKVPQASIHIDDSSSLSSVDERDDTAKHFNNQRCSVPVNCNNEIDEVDGYCSDNRVAHPYPVSRVSKAEGKVEPSTCYNRFSVLHTDGSKYTKPIRGRHIGYENKESIEKWVEETNLKTGISPARKDSKQADDKFTDTTSIHHLGKHRTKFGHQQHRGKFDVQVCTSNTSHETIEKKVQRLPESLIRRKRNIHSHTRADIGNGVSEGMNQTFTVSQKHHRSEIHGRSFYSKEHNTEHQKTYRLSEPRMFDEAKPTSERPPSDERYADSVDYYINLDDMNNNDKTSTKNVKPSRSSSISINMFKGDDSNRFSREVINDPWTSPLPFKKKIRRKFVPREDTAKLINLIIQPQPEVTQMLSPRSFHRQYNEYISAINPYVETEQYLDRYMAEKMTKTTHLESQSSGERTSCNVQQAVKMPCESKYSNLSSLNTWIKVSHRQSYKECDSTVWPFCEYGISTGASSTNLERRDDRFVPSRFDDDRMDPVGFRDELRKYNTMCREQNNNNDISLKKDTRQAQMFSPYKSAKDLTNIEIFANNSFYSPDVPRRLSHVHEDTSKSVPAKLIHSTKDSTTSKSRYENGPLRFSRTKLRAKRSLPMEEPVEVSHIDNRCVSNRLSTLHTPSKTDITTHTTKNTRLEDSPSSVLSRLNLSTPSRCRDHFTRFKAQIPHLSSNDAEMTQRSEEIHTDVIVDKRNEKRLQNCRIPSQQDLLHEEANLRTNRFSKTNLVDQYISSDNTEQTLLTTSDKRNEKRLQNCSIPSQQDLLHEEANLRTNRFSKTNLVDQYISSDNTEQTLLTTSGYTRDCSNYTSHNMKSQANAQKYSDTQPRPEQCKVVRNPNHHGNERSSVSAQRILPNYDLIKVGWKGRRKALFQSTPMKTNDMCALDSTISTIHDAMSDESDCEIVTISP